MEYISRTSSIVSKGDIIKEMSLELGISENKLNEIVDLNIKYIKEKVKNSDITIIRLPNLCTIRFNYKLGKSSLVYTKKLVENNTRNLKIKALTSKIEVLKNIKLTTDNWMDLLNFSNPLFEKLWRKDKRIKYNKFLYQNSNKIIEELEVKTNEILNKIK